MITTDFGNTNKVQIKKTLEISPDIFDRARGIYRECVAFRSDPIVITRDGERYCLLRWKDNNNTQSNKKNTTKIAICEDYWEYSFDAERMDLRLLMEADLFVFDEIEEYSAAIRRILRKYFPDKGVIFLDEHANSFFAEDEKVGTADSFENVQKSASVPLDRIMHICGDGSSTILKEKVKNKQYASLQIMHSIYWLSNETCFGEKNDDKLIGLIKSPLAFEGLAGVLRYVLNKAEAMEKSGYPIIPVVDLGIIGDDNQFVSGTGENVWDLYFEPLSDISLEEVYQSRHVISASEGMKTSNPWLWKQDYESDYSELIPKYLKFNKTTSEYIDNLYSQTVPEHQGKILGVIGRGSDYNMALPKALDGLLMRPITPEEILEKTKKLVAQRGYEYVFLATEDAVVLDLFKDSDIEDKLLCVQQERVDYSEYSDKSFLADIYKGMEGRDGYAFNLRYLGIIYILSKCDALISTTLCGAARAAWGMRKGEFEYADLPGIKTP